MIVRSDNFSFYGPAQSNTRLWTYYSDFKDVPLIFDEFMQYIIHNNGQQMIKS